MSTSVSFALGVLTVLSIVLICYCLCEKRRRRKNLSNTTKEMVYVEDPEPVYESILPFTSAIPSNGCTVEMSSNAAYGRCRYIHI